MIRKKKAILFEAFARILVMIFAIWVVFTIGKKIAEAAGIGTSDIGEEFNKFVKEINELKVGDANPFFVILDTDTAIVAFGKASSAYECYDCGTEKGGLSYFFKKPETEQCNNKACICLCRNSLKTFDSKAPYSITCDKMSCTALNENQDLAGSVELKKYFEDLEKRDPGKHTGFMNARWKGGFLLERHSRSFSFNALPSQQFRRFTIFVDKSQKGNIVYTTVCPGFDCTSQSPSEIVQQPQGLLKGCEIMRECVAETKVYLERDRYGDSILRECRSPDKVKATFETESDCNEVNKCMFNKININGQCEKNNRNNYVLSFNQPPPNQ